MIKNVQKLVFCQASGDINYCLGIINNSPNYLIIITLKSVYKTVINYNIFEKDRILFIPYPKSIKDYILFRTRIKSAKNQLNNIFFKEAYIFSLGFDWISLSLLAFLSNKIGSIYYIDLYSNIKDVRIYYSIPALIRSTYYFLLTGVKFQYYSRIDNRLVVIYKDEKNRIIDCKKEDFNNSQKKFLDCGTNYSNCIVFIDSMSKTFKDNIEQDLLEDILSIIEEQQLPLYIKKHPNSNFTFAFMKKYPQADNLPIELIDLSKCKCVIGVGSGAIVNNNAPLKISLLEILKKKELKDEVKRFKSHLNQLDSEKSVEYPSSINKLSILLKE